MISEQQYGMQADDAHVIWMHLIYMFITTHINHTRT